MDLNLLLSSLQLALAAFQLKLDHFTHRNRVSETDLDAFYDLGEAIRSLESALAETVAYIGQTNEREPNPRLASLWDNASQSIRRVQGTSELADIAFEKNLYWRNPDFYNARNANVLYRISLGNVLVHLRQLRTLHDRLQAKIIRQRE